jgi:hypothetical protein
MTASNETVVLSTLEKRKAALAKARAIKKENPDLIHRKTVIQIWELDKSSLRKSINAKCFDCSNYQKEEVSNCTVKTCPLWEVRPWK